MGSPRINDHRGYSGARGQLSPDWGANFQLFINKQFSASDRYPCARDIHFDLGVCSLCGRLKLATNSEGQVHDFSLETLSRARVR